MDVFCFENRFPLPPFLSLKNLKVLLREIDNRKLMSLKVIYFLSITEEILCITFK